MVEFKESYLAAFAFEKSSEDIIAAAHKKTAFLVGKIAERKARITRIREEYKIDDGALIKLLEDVAEAAKRNEARMTYSYKNSMGGDDDDGEEVVIGAGVASNLLVEKSAIKAEERQIERLGYVIRNLRDLMDTEGRVRGHRLSYGELEYLGF